MLLTHVFGSKIFLLDPSIFIYEVEEIIQVHKFALRVTNPLIIEFTQYVGRTEYMPEIAQDENVTVSRDAYNNERPPKSWYVCTYQQSLEGHMETCLPNSGS